MHGLSSLSTSLPLQSCFSANILFAFLIPPPLSKEISSSLHFSLPGSPSNRSVSLLLNPIIMFFSLSHPIAYFLIPFLPLPHPPTSSPPFHHLPLCHPLLFPKKSSSHLLLLKKFKYDISVPRELRRPKPLQRKEPKATNSTRCILSQHNGNGSQTYWYQVFSEKCGSSFVVGLKF